MIRFECDYAELVHPKILKLICDSNVTNPQYNTYGEDSFCDKAKSLIRGECGSNEVDVHFFVGGTQTNKVVISSALRPHEGVISAVSGHINTHETGAIESTGHKVIALDTPDGKLTAEQVSNYYIEHMEDSNREHVVKPKMVYISNPTEYGTIYTKEELVLLSKTCIKNNLLLYMDGARLTYALTSSENDLTMSDIANLCDLFYIGGTKAGAMIGEALVITNETLKADFRYLIKQGGALLAKGYLLGMQFTGLFTDNLFYEIGKKANKQAEDIKNAFLKKGYELKLPTSTNQVFPIIPTYIMNKLQEKYTFSYWEKAGESVVVRFCTSFATTDENVALLVADIEKL